MVPKVKLDRALLKLAVNKGVEKLETEPSKADANDPLPKPLPKKSLKRVSKEDIKGLIGQFMQARGSLGSAQHREPD